MAWTNPTSRSTGELITASIYNTDLVDNLNYLKGAVDASQSDADTAQAASPVGHLKMWPTNTAPTGFLLCHGQAVSRTGYSALFAAIGTTFGSGDGTTTFNLPDLRGRFPLGQDDMGGSSANRVTAAAADTIGGASGAETHTLTETELASHRHSATAGNSGTNLFNYFDPMEAGTTGTLYTNYTGGGGAHNNMPPYLTINFIIYTGV